ncbi:hypothetical protein RQP46_008214 [Phenoliferia psychrophenolica]
MGSRSSQQDQEAGSASRKRRRGSTHPAGSPAPSAYDGGVTSGDDDDAVVAQALLSPSRKGSAKRPRLSSNGADDWTAEQDAELIALAKEVLDDDLVIAGDPEPDWDAIGPLLTPRREPDEARERWNLIGKGDNNTTRDSPSRSRSRSKAATADANRAWEPAEDEILRVVGASMDDSESWEDHARDTFTSRTAEALKDRWAELTSASHSFSEKKPARYKDPLTDDDKKRILNFGHDWLTSPHGPNDTLSFASLVNAFPGRWANELLGEYEKENERWKKEDVTPMPKEDRKRLVGLPGVPGLHEDLDRAFDWRTLQNEPFLTRYSPIEIRHHYLKQAKRDKKKSLRAAATPDESPAPDEAEVGAGEIEQNLGDEENGEEIEVEEPGEEEQIEVEKAVSEPGTEVPESEGEVEPEGTNSLDISDLLHVEMLTVVDKDEDDEFDQLQSKKDGSAAPTDKDDPMANLSRATSASVVSERGRTPATKSPLDDTPSASASPLPPPEPTFEKPSEPLPPLPPSTDDLPRPPSRQSSSSVPPRARTSGTPASVGTVWSGEDEEKLREIMKVPGWDFPSKVDTLEAAFAKRFKAREIIDKSDTLRDEVMADVGPVEPPEPELPAPTSHTAPLPAVVLLFTSPEFIAKKDAAFAAIERLREGKRARTNPAGDA